MLCTLFGLADSKLNILCYILIESAKGQQILENIWGSFLGHLCTIKFLLAYWVKSVDTG